IGDITAHGSKAAGLRRRIVKAIAPLYEGAKNPQLQKVYDKLHVLVERENDILPAIHGRFNWRKGLIKYFNAAHPPVLLLRGGEVREVMPSAQAFLGAIREKVELKELKLEEGDRLFFMTDGIFEHVKQNGDSDYESRILPKEGIIDAIKKHSGKPLNAHVQEIFKTLDAWEKQRNDDQTIFALEVKRKSAGNR
ncbi:MAG TPA: PP2C family protein-serine/threonine phosphatase, partial [Candidatus Norongarragalinales archaeon]|nr:PP2C family protein-serine/threonine phosphatase [Candidatus Norongarragalinales archaeon]